MSDAFKPNRYPFWSPRFWHGMRLGTYLRLLARNRFNIHATRLPMAGLVAGCTTVNSLLAAAQSLIFRRALAEAQIAPPLFIVGHWRTGTTWLHELLSADRQFAFPSNYDCFTPHHTLLTRRWMSWLLGALLPARRPMDDMPLHPDVPQEDEFAICSLGGPTPYLRMAFPAHGPVHQDLFDLDSARAEARDALREAIETFARILAARCGERRLIFKSPPHTGRIRALAEWFPGAQFVHIARDPYRVVPSTLKLWRSLHKFQAFQHAGAREEELEAYVFDCATRMYAAYFRQRSAIDQGSLIELQFERLIAEPEAVLRQIYAQLGLEGFASAWPAMSALVAARRDYREQTPPIDRRLRETISSRWTDYFNAFGYAAIPRERVEV